jgi:hypothetical protein
MSSSIFLWLKHGSRMTLLQHADAPMAEAVRANLDKWVRHGQALEIGHASGAVEETCRDTIERVEIVADAEAV